MYCVQDKHGWSRYDRDGCLHCKTRADVPIVPAIAAPSSTPDQEHIHVRVIEHTIYTNFKLEGAAAIAAHKLSGGALQNVIFNAADSVLYAGSHPVRLVLGKQHEDSISMTAIFFIDKATAASMSTCRKSNPGKLTNDDRIPTHLTADIQRYMAVKFGDTAVDKSSLELIYVAIDRYCSDSIAETRGSTGIYLVGDSCFGTVLPRPDQRSQVRQQACLLLDAAWRRTSVRGKGVPMVCVSALAPGYVSS